MKSILYFPMSEVSRIIKHAMETEKHCGTYAQTHDENFELIESPIVPPGLIWVKDWGIYLMSNGIDGSSESNESRGLVSYALGFDPKKNPDYLCHQSDAVGGDDFAENIDLDWINENFGDKTTGYFFIEVYDEKFGMGWTPTVD